MELPNSFFNHDAQAGGFYPRSHAGVDITRLGVKQNTLVEGIRGTGKTHILKMISRFYLDNFVKYKVLPIYISLAQISEHARKDPNEFRLHLYAHIVQRCIETAEVYRSYLQPDKGLLVKAMEMIAKLFGIKEHGNLDDLLVQIRQTAEHLLFKLQFDLTSQTLTDVNTQQLDDIRKMSGGIRIGAGPASAASSADSIAQTTFANSLEESLSYMGNKLVHRNAAGFLVEFLRQIQVILDLDYCLILLDECSEASPEAQVEIFRLFKTIRGASSGLPNRESSAFFIGTVYPQGETYYPIREKDGFSFEPGQDCTVEFLQWDESDMESYLSFFSTMTFNRASEVLEFPGDSDNLLNQLFEERKTFLLAAFAAHGLPRRYWEIIKRGYDPEAKQVLTNRVELAVQEIANDHILGHESISEQDSNFVFALVRVMTDRNRSNERKHGRNPQNIYFSINRRYSHLLRRMIMQGAIHDKSRMRTRKKNRRPQPVYALDLSIAYTFRVLKADEFEVTVAKDIPRGSEEDFEQAVIISSKGIKGIFEPKEEEKADDSDLVEEIEAEDIKPGQASQGVVVAYKPGKRGEIETDEGGVAIFQENNVDAKFRKSIKVGDKVSFVYKIHSSGEKLALKVKKVFKVDPPIRRHEGLVKTYEVSEFGFVEVLDGGSDAYFVANDLPENLKTSIKPGDRLVFEVLDSPNGRRAININVPPALPRVNEKSLQDIADYVIRYVNSSPTSVSLAKMAFQIRIHFGDSVSNTQWFGYSTFKNLLLELDLVNLDMTSTAPGYIFNPKVHKISNMNEEATPEDLRNSSSLASVVAKIEGLHIPYLSSEIYQIVFEELANVVNQTGFTLNNTSKVVKDRVSARGFPLARSTIQHISVGLVNNGYSFSGQKESGINLAKAYADAIFKLCKRENIELSVSEKKKIQQWIGGDAV